MMDVHKRLSEDLEKVIIKDDASSTVTSESDQNLLPVPTFREKVYRVLHNHKFQIAVITLVIIDCLLVIIELLIDLEHEHVGQQIVHYCSIGILSLFIVEIMFKLYAFRLEFFQHKLEIFDAVVVIVSFSLDIAFRSSHDAMSGVGLIIILRLWRVVRVLNGIVLSVKKQAERRLDHERQARLALESELSRSRQLCMTQQKELDALRTYLHQKGIDYEHLPQSNRVDVIAEVNHTGDKT